MLVDDRFDGGDRFEKGRIVSQKQRFEVRHFLGDGLSRSVEWIQMRLFSRNGETAGGAFHFTESRRNLLQFFQHFMGVSKLARGLLKLHPGLM